MPMHTHSHGGDEAKRILCPIHWYEVQPERATRLLECYVCGRQLKFECHECQRFKDDYDEKAQGFMNHRKLINEFAGVVDGNKQPEKEQLLFRFVVARDGIFTGSAIIAIDRINSDKLKVMKPLSPPIPDPDGNEPPIQLSPSNEDANENEIEEKEIDLIRIIDTNLARGSKWEDFLTLIFTDNELYLWAPLKEKAIFKTLIDEDGDYFAPDSILGVLELGMVEFTISTEAPLHLQKKTLELWVVLDKIDKMQERVLKPLLAQMEGGLEKKYLLVELIKIYNDKLAGRNPKLEKAFCSFYIKSYQYELDIDYERKTNSDGEEVLVEIPPRINIYGLYHLDADTNNVNLIYHEETYINDYDVEDDAFIRKFKPKLISWIIFNKHDLGRENWDNYIDLVDSSYEEELEIIVKNEDIVYKTDGIIEINGPFHLRKKYINEEEVNKEMAELQQKLAKAYSDLQVLKDERDNLQVQLNNERNDNVTNRDRIQQLEDNIVIKDEQIRNAGDGLANLQDAIRRLEEEVAKFIGEFTIDQQKTSITDLKPFYDAVGLFRTYRFTVQGYQNYWEYVELDTDDDPDLGADI